MKNVISREIALHFKICNLNFAFCIGLANFSKVNRLFPQAGMGINGLK